MAPHSDAFPAGSPSRAGAPLDLRRLLEAVRTGAPLASSPDHGEHHWRTVSHLALELATGEPAADRLVLFLFGLLHDARRQNDYRDPGHGRRGARLVCRLYDDRLLPITTTQLETLAAACDGHTDGHTSTHPTIGRCWDADRLHLPRVGIHPDPALFSTERARTSPPPVPHPPPAWDELLASVWQTPQ